MSNMSDETPVIRIARMRALPGKLDELLAAGKGNADDAMASPGCRSVEVCTDPEDADGMLMISCWDSLAALKGFLEWHETIAHASLADFSVEKPTAVHYPVVETGA